MNYTEGTFSVFPAGIANGLPPGEQVALAWLYHHKAKGNSERLPSLNTLAVECGMTKRSLITQIEALAKRGLVSVTRVEEPSGRQVNSYELPMRGEISSPTVVELVSPKVNRWDAKPYLMIWKDRYGGYFPVDKTATVLKRAEKDHGREVVIEALKVYCQKTEGTYAGIHRFCATINVYTKKNGHRVYDEAVVTGEKRW